MAKMGRPRKEIDQTQFEKLCHMQCTKEEIADFFFCDESTIERWCKRTYHVTFATIFKQKRNGGHVSLRRKQWHLGTNNVTMAIWLGKQYLGQKDYPDDSIDAEDSDAYFELAAVEPEKEAEIIEESTGDSES